MKEFLKYFPIKIRQALEEIEFEKVEEIRIRNGRNIRLKYSTNEKNLDVIVSTEDILRILQAICENSIYSYQNKIAEGFVTIKGGHRVGICGTAVIENEKVINISHIFSLNFRIAKEVKGCSKELKKIVYENGEIFNTIILSPPGKGKTTILRDLIRELSKEKNIGIVDERNEICSMYNGVPQKDIGEKVDILENVSKNIGLKMLVRTMAPEIVVADEIGTEEDIKAIHYAISSGVKGIFTAHGNNIEEVKQNPILNKLFEQNLIQKIVFLDEKERGRIKDVYIVSGGKVKNDLYKIRN